MDIQKIIAAQEKNQKSLIKRANVVSVGTGYKTKNGKLTDEICIVVGVSEKLPTTGLFAADIIPNSVDGITIDVIETGKFQSQQKSSSSSQEIDPTKKFRPAMPGISIGEKTITAGTFGCVVEKNGTKLILSNNHVLAAVNEAPIGSDIYQPGPIDGGTATDKIGTLFDFIPIDFGGGTEDPPPATCPIAKGTAGAANLVAKLFRRNHRLAKLFRRNHRLMAVNTDPMAVTNRVDAALCLPDDGIEIIEEIIQIGKPTNTKEATLGMDVQKYGRTTKYTTGTLTQMNVTVQVSYGPGKVATFVGQIMAGGMSAGGDSGSACLNMDNELVGLLYAGSANSTIFNPIQDVFDQLSITLPA